MPQNRDCREPLRRMKQSVGDIEILYIPMMDSRPDGLFRSEFSLADKMIDKWIDEGKIQKRPNINGGFIWGEKNKLAIHVASGIPIDFFRYDI